MQRNILIAVAAGLASATLHMSGRWSLIGGLFLALLAPLPLFAVGLGLGAGAAVTAAFTALIAIGAVSDLRPALVFLSAEALPALIVIRLALLGRPDAHGKTEWYPPGLLLTWIALYGAGAFVAVAIFTGTGPQGLEALIATFVEGLRGLVAESQRNSPRVNELLRSITSVFPFLLGTWWIFSMAINGVLAQKFLCARGLNRRPADDLRTLVLPQWLAVVVVAAAVVALLGSDWLGFMALNIALILCVPYFLVGLAVLHWVVKSWRAKKPILFALYATLMFLGWPALVLLGLGFAEHWMNLRGRIGGSSRGNERNE